MDAINNIYTSIPVSVEEYFLVLSDHLLSGLFVVGAVAVGWLVLYAVVLRRLPPVREALGLKPPDKPTREELKDEIDALKEGHKSMMIHNRPYIVRPRNK